MKRSVQIQVSLAAFFGVTAVTTGALGAHYFEAILHERNKMGAWETAVLYHLAHAVVLLALAVWSAAKGASRIRSWAAGCLAAGIFLFSGSIYALSLGGPGFLWPVTPLGGVLLMAGWILILLQAWTSPFRSAS